MKEDTLNGNINKNDFWDSDEERRILSTAIDQISVAVVLTDIDANIIYANNAFETITGYSINEVIGKNPRILKSGLTSDVVYEKMWNIISNGGIWNGEQINKKKDGSFYYEDSRITPIYNKKGELTYYMAVKHDITRRKMLEEKLKEIALKDSLTDTYNRWYVFERLAQILDNYKRARSTFSISIIDIDHFKEVNDKYGHQAGDYILKEFTKIINEDIRSYDILGRYGGEEFILILLDTDKKKAQYLLRRILKRVSEKEFTYKEDKIRLRFSAGIADASEIELKDLDIDRLIGLADKRLYNAKETGRSKIVI